MSVTLSPDPANVITVPASVQINQGNTGASFSVTGAQLGTTTLTASANGHQSGSRQIRVRPLSLSWASTPLIVPPGSSQVVLQLSDPAPAGGLTVALSSADPAIVTVPATTSAPAGASQLLVTVTGLIEAETTLTASTTGYEPATGAIRVERIDLSFDPPDGSIPQGLDEPFVVRSSRPGRRTIVRGHTPPTKTRKDLNQAALWEFAGRTTVESDFRLACGDSRVAIRLRQSVLQQAVNGRESFVVRVVSADRLLKEVCVIVGRNADFIVRWYACEAKQVPTTIAIAHSTQPGELLKVVTLGMQPAAPWVYIVLSEREQVPAHH